jgi:hypothetical protein
MMRSIRTIALLGLPLLISQGCSTPPRSAPVTAALVCAVGTTVAPAESISVATTLPIGAAHAIQPTNAAERFVFAQVYETLIDVDCEGHAYAGLAKSWTIDDSRTRITLQLRDDARFSNGDALTTRDVVAAWRATGETSSDPGQLARRLAAATTIVDDHSLMISLPDTESLVLAEPALAVYRQTAGATWPEGSGTHRVVESAPGMLILAPLSAGSEPRIMVRSRRSADARDAIDAGADVLLAADPMSVSYASTRPNLSAVSLPWTRTYALAVPNRSANGVAAWLAYASDTAAALRASLARDAVRADARAAQSPRWWTAAAACEWHGLGAPRRTEPNARIVYRSDDPIARGLAERLVAVGRRATAAPLAAADFPRALRTGNESAYVVALPRSSLTPCRDMTLLRASAPWLTASEGAPDVLIPLIDTREHPIVNVEHVSAVIGWDGTLRVTGGPGPKVRP